VPEDVKSVFSSLLENWQRDHRVWIDTWANYQSSYPNEASALQKMMDGEVQIPWDTIEWDFPASLETRRAQGQVIAKVSESLQQLIGGSADLTHNVFTEIPGGGEQSASCPGGRNISFGEAFEVLVARSWCSVIIAVLPCD
jgi:transketolase